MKRWILGSFVLSTACSASGDRVTFAKPGHLPEPYADIDLGARRGDADHADDAEDEA